LSVTSIKDKRKGDERWAANRESRHASEPTRQEADRKGQSKKKKKTEDEEKGQ
jgi:hypothetical protein